VLLSWPLLLLLLLVLLLGLLWSYSVSQGSGVLLSRPLPLPPLLPGVP
jgi:hypothetical protein